MAGSRANLAVTKDGETYNKLQRPDNLFDRPAAIDRANERKRERAAVEKPVAGPASGNKRAKTDRLGMQANKSQHPDDRHQQRSAGPMTECGMRTTLPIDNDEEQSDDSMGEALAYLRSVRSEASTIPHLLVASKPHNDDAHKASPPNAPPYTSRHTFYQDGAWISVDEDYNAMGKEQDERAEPPPTELYYKQLVRRFQNLRSKLGHHRVNRQEPVDGAKDGANHFPSDNPPTNRHEWLYTLDRAYPTLAQISQLDEKGVRRGLEYCAYTMDRFDTISGPKSCWIWSLLALSGEVGTLDSQKMSHIRDLGSKASRLSTDLHQGSGCPNDGNQKTPPADQIFDRSDHENKENGTVLFEATAYDRCAGTGYVQSNSSGDPDPDHQNMPNKTAPEGQKMQSVSTTSDVPHTSACLEGSPNTDTGYHALERARAHLLAQLGDNLIQAGMPTSLRNVSETRSDQTGQLDEGQRDSQLEVKVRAIPSRVEAERQRQLMRNQSSYTAVPQSEPTAVTHPIAENPDLCAVDLNTRVTIDMILTVAGECYGQRDLLRFRKPW